MNQSCCDDAEQEVPVYAAVETIESGAKNLRVWPDDPVEKEEPASSEEGGADGYSNPQSKEDWCKSSQEVLAEGSPDSADRLLWLRHFCQLSCGKSRDSHS